MFDKYYLALCNIPRPAQFHAAPQAPRTVPDRNCFDDFDPWAIYSFMYPCPLCMQTFICAIVNSCIYIGMQSCIRSYIHSCMHALTCHPSIRNPFIHGFVLGHSLVPTSILVCVCCWCTHFIHSLLRAFIVANNIANRLLNALAT